MFLIEGLITLSIGVASFWLTPQAPSKTRTSFRKNGYLSDVSVFLAPILPLRALS